MADSERLQRFFALAVEPKKLYSQTPQYNLHITQVVLDPEATNKDRSVLIAQVDGHNVPIASLRLGTTEQVQLDVLFDEGVELSFSVRGSNTLHVIGYFVHDLEGESEEEDEESEEDLDEEDFQQAVLNKKARRDIEAAEAEAAASDEDDDDEDFDADEADEEEDEDEEESDEQEPANGGGADSASKKRVRLPDEADKATAKATPAKKAKPTDGASAANGAAKPAVAASAKPAGSPTTPAKNAAAATPAAKTAAVAAGTPGTPKQPTTPVAAAGETKSQKKKRKQLEKAAAKEAAAAATPQQTPGATPKKPAEPIKRTLPSGLQIEEVLLGHGKVAEPGKLVGVKYVGRLMDGKIFDQSKNKPFSFRLGTGQVIKGWDDGLKGMRVGGKRRLIIPPAMAYGRKGAGSDIPPNATLSFDVELLSA